MRCHQQNPGPNTHGPAVAILTAAPSGNRIAICERDLNWWLDDADDGVGDEPSALEFLRPNG